MLYIDDALEDIRRAKALLDRAFQTFERGKEAFKRSPITETLSTWIALDREHDALDGSRKSLNTEIEHFSKSVIPERFEREGIKTTTVVTPYGNFRLTVGQRSSATMLDKERAFQWLRDNGHEGIIQETVPAQTLASFANALLEDFNQELPDDLFKVGKVPYTSKTKVKG